MLTGPDLNPSSGSKAILTSPRILDLFLQGDLLDGDIDAAVDAYLANPTVRSYVLQSLYRVDFDEITASTLVAAKPFSPTANGDYRQALMCALLLHRPQLVRSFGAEQIS
ncbi:hypothetical protein [Methylobacterium oryzisoli]|uniref:hypothetical protein n=1 Tax=Methylobacterium oryzisoli TaxID=3385502 RepID=UPI003892C4F0